MSTDKPISRSIKSFVRRSGRMTASQQNALKTYWPIYGIEFSQSQPDFASGFEALKLEIGIGNGDAIIDMATADPCSLYLGIEVHEPGIGRCLNIIHKQELGNVRLIKHDAVEVLEHMIAPGTLDRVLLFFPDPQGLKPGASIHIATDWQDYAESIAAQFLADARFINEGDANGCAEAPAYRPLTRFERRGRRLGHGVWDLVFTKK
jgi:tRNA (guanine-N7-)-methyltransferase